MIDPYSPPPTLPEHNVSASKSGNSAPLVGCLSGGCLMPTVLFLLAAFFGDTGGPLIWPMLAIVLGALGAFLGFGYKMAKKNRE